MQKGACPSCGLALTRWRTFEGTAPPPDPLLDEAFVALQMKWADPAVHDSFLTLAQQAGALDGAAARYRHYLRTTRGDPDAQRALEKLAALAAHQQANAPKEGLAGAGTVYYIALAITVILLAVIGIIVWTVVTVRRGSP